VQGPLDDDRLAAWRAFFEVQATVVPALEQELLRECGLMLSWYEVLLHLAEAPGRRLTMGALAASTLLSKSGLTKIVDAMESRGLVARAPSPTDRRATFVELTPAGRALLRRAWSVHATGIDRLFGRHLEASEVVVLAEALGRVRAAARDAR